MSYKVKIKPLFLLFSLFLTGLFFSSTVQATESNELWYSGSRTATGLFVDSSYYDSGTLKVNLKYDSNAPYSYNELYFQTSYNQNFQQQLYMQTTGGNYIFFSYFDCPTEYKVYKLNSWNENIEWCKVQKGETLSIKLHSITYNGTTITNANGLTKTDIDNAFGSNFLESTRGIVLISMYRDNGTRVENFDSWYIYHSSINPYPIGFPVVPTVINGTCGLDNGQTISATPPTPPRTLCSSGTATTLIYSDYEWYWTCEGSGGGTTDYCIAYETFVPATCGIDNDQTVSTVSNFCSYGDLVVPSFVETITGWNWTCQRDTTTATCSAIRGTETPPVIPEQEDCSTLSVPDKWFCQISNAVQGAFLPTPSKLNELNSTVNLIGQKFPFNYITTAKYSLETISISQSLPSITLLGNTGTINISGITSLSENVRNFTSILIIFMFIFWLIGYIKNFFK